MSKPFNRTSIMGDIGEDLVARYLGCKLSEDRWDSEKDMTDANGRQVEVKTQNRYGARNVFSIRRDKEINLNKCMEVERLIFVEYDSSDEITIWEVRERNDFQDYETKPYGRNPRGLRMRGWNIDSMIKLHVVHDPDLARQLRELSSSAVFSPTGKHYKPAYVGTIPCKGYVEPKKPALPPMPIDYSNEKSYRPDVYPKSYQGI